MGEKESIPHWHCNKRWMDVNKTRDALAILASKDFEGKTWTEGKQAFYAIQLNKGGLSESTNPRSTRAILGTFKLFGFAWAPKRKIEITQAGKEFIKGDISKTLRLQLLKWQYPNPYESKGIVAHYTQSLQLFPFRVLLRILSDLGSLTVDELALFVWRTMNATDEEIERVKRSITDYRLLDDKTKKQQRDSDQLFVTNHEYEAHLRPYILATDLCVFDSKSRSIMINNKQSKVVGEILADKSSVKVDWESEEEWFRYYGNTQYLNPPRQIVFKLKPSKGIASGFFVRVTQDGFESYGFSDERGEAFFNLYKESDFRVEVIRPQDGSTVFTRSYRLSNSVLTIDIPLKVKLGKAVESRDSLFEKIEQLLSRRLDDELKDKLSMRVKFTGTAITRKGNKQLRGARFEQLVYGVFKSFKPEVFEDVIWNGKVGEWGLPIAAQKINEITGKKLPDILVFGKQDLYVVETTLLRGRSQWEKPEAVSVPDHVEDMIATYKERNVSGLFIAEKLDPSVETNLVTRAVNKGYQIVPMEVSNFLETMKLLAKNPLKDFWTAYYNNLWNIHKRVATRKEK